MSPMLALLNEMRSHRIAMYVGANSLTKLADFLRGCEFTIGRLLPNETDHLLADFRDWIYQRFQTTENISWERVILRQSGDEGGAVLRFWELLDEFLRHRGALDVPHAKVVPLADGSAAPATSAQGTPKH